MILSKSNVVHYLAEQGLLAWESVVEGDLLVADASRRNRNFKIIRRRRPGLFVKQIQHWDPQAVAGLGTEAACYRLAREGAAAALADLVPRDFLYDSQRHVLVSELLADGEPLGEHHRRLNAFPPEPSRLLGALFGQLHREPPTLVEWPEAALFRRQPAWILSAHQQGANLFSSLSAANAQLLQIVQSYPEFQRTLGELRDEWRADRLMHGDIKWDNCVVYPAPARGGALALKVVDWELADIGDLRWDLGALLQAYIAAWVLSMQASPETPPAQLAQTAQYPIERMQPAIRAFWQAYVEARGLERQAAAPLLTQSMRYGAARMIQTAYEYMQFSPQISPTALCLLQVSFNVLREPSEARDPSPRPVRRRATMQEALATGAARGSSRRSLSRRRARRARGPDRAPGGRRRPGAGAHAGADPLVAQLQQLLYDWCYCRPFGGLLPRRRRPRSEPGFVEALVGREREPRALGSRLAHPAGLAEQPARRGQGRGDAPRLAGRVPRRWRSRLCRRSPAPGQPLRAAGVADDAAGLLLRLRRGARRPGGRVLGAALLLEHRAEGAAPLRAA